MPQPESAWRGGTLAIQVMIEVPRAYSAHPGLAGWGGDAADVEANKLLVSLTNATSIGLPDAVNAAHCSDREAGPPLPGPGDLSGTFQTPSHCANETPLYSGRVLFSPVQNSSLILFPIKKVLVTKYINLSIF